jgi:hypothetical protein
LACPQATKRGATWSYWPGVSEEKLAAAAQCAQTAASEPRRQGREFRFRGSILVVADETVFCLFEGLEADVRAVSEQAGVPFERVLESLRIDGKQRQREGGTAMNNSTARIPIRQSVRQSCEQLRHSERLTNLLEEFALWTALWTGFPVADDLERAQTRSTTRPPTPRNRKRRPFRDRLVASRAEARGQRSEPSATAVRR